VFGFPVSAADIVKDNAAVEADTLVVFEFGFVLGDVWISQGAKRPTE
jgi:hypothetical protein